ncbi:MAG: MEDS domain-containing protein [Chloroflexi bacterium]|nr:MEDS domain-containing protein [Chloroflexota bacterium]
MTIHPNLVAPRTSDGFRKTGIDVIGNVPWGTHICQFYQTRNDLLDVLTPYFKAGLENNEFCMWVTSPPLGVEQAKRSLRRVVCDLDDRIKKGQIEILDHSQWYIKSGKFESDKVLASWVEKENLAVDRGFDGIRLTGNNGWLEETEWGKFVEYEAAINNVIGKYRMLAICSYSLKKCGASELIDVVNNHQFALIRRRGEWMTIENSERRRMGERLEELACDLGERAKELSCMHGIEDLIQTPEISLEEIFQGAVDLIPSAWQYSEITSAQLTLNGQTFATPSFRETPWCQSGRVIVQGDPIGTLEVSYGEERPIAAEGPFLREERNLLNDVCERLGRLIEYRQVEVKLQEKELFNFALFQLNPLPSVVTDTEGRVVKSNLAKKYLSDRMPDIGDLMYVDYAAKHEIDMRAQLMECINFQITKEFPEQKYGNKFLSITMYPVPHGAVIMSKDITNQKQLDMATRRRLEVETTIARISSRFAGFSNVDEAITASLEDLGKLSKVNRACLFLLREDGTTMDNTHEWCAEGLPPMRESFRGIPCELFSWWMRQLRDGQAIHIEDVSKMPDEAKIEKQVLESQHIGSLLALPLNVGAELAGFVGVVNDSVNRASNENDLVIVRVCSDVIGNALERRELDKRIEIVIKASFEAQETERERICLEVHDGVTQTMTSVFQYLQSMESFMPEGSQARPLLHRTTALAKQAIQESRNIVNNTLQPMLLKDLGLMATLQEEIRQLERDNKWKVTLEAKTTTLPANIETGLYWIIHEAINNARKHSNSNRLLISITSTTSGVEAVIRDWGIGFDHTSDIYRKRGTGIFSMCKRAEFLRGTCSIQSQPGNGTTIHIILPLSGNTIRSNHG